MTDLNTARLVLLSLFLVLGIAWTILAFVNGCG